jgi:dephospho-CoA kinase
MSASSKHSAAVTVIRMGEQENPASLHEYDAGWGLRAAQYLANIRGALVGLPGAADAAYDHIGSTAVPGLAAKPFVDLQVRMFPLPSHAELGSCLEPLGFERALGARPDSPGVGRDIPRGDEPAPDEVWEKRLYVLREESVILHLRRSDSPWGRHTVWFRDWLREHPAERARYEQTKRELSKQSAGKPDYDDYTRAKTAFFDEAQQSFTAWARARG